MEYNTPPKVTFSYSSLLTNFQHITEEPYELKGTRHVSLFHCLLSDYLPIA